MIQTWKKPQKQKLLNILKPSKKAETNGDRACEVLVFVRSLEGPVLKPRQIKPEKKNIFHWVSGRHFKKFTHFWQYCSHGAWWVHGENAFLLFNTHLVRTVLTGFNEEFLECQNLICSFTNNVYMVTSYRNFTISMGLHTCNTSPSHTGKKFSFLHYRKK